MLAVMLVMAMSDVVVGDVNDIGDDENDGYRGIECEPEAP